MNERKPDGSQKGVGVICAEGSECFD